MVLLCCLDGARLQYTCSWERLPLKPVISTMASVLAENPPVPLLIARKVRVPAVGSLKEKVAAPAEEVVVRAGKTEALSKAAIDEPAPFVPTLQACAGCAATLRIPLRDLLHYHGGVRVFRTRQLLLDVQALSRHRGGRPPLHPSGH